MVKHVLTNGDAWSKVWKPNLDYCKSLPNVLRTAISFAVIYRYSSLLESLQWFSIVSKFTNFSMDLRSSIMCPLANFSDSSYLDWLLLLHKHVILLFMFFLYVLFFPLAHWETIQFPYHVMYSIFLPNPKQESLLLSQYIMYNLQNLSLHRN